MYEKLLSSAEPGLIIIMLDQSGSMADAYIKDSKGNVLQNKATFAALAVNRVIEEVISACSDGDNIKERCHVAIIGYGSTAKVLTLDNVAELAKNPNTTEILSKQIDPSGKLVDVPETLRVFVNPLASGGTAMDSAFEEAYNGANTWIQNNKNSFPPIVINITDGEPNEYYMENGSFNKTIQAAQKLTSLSTSDGNLVLLNAHIPDEKSNPGNLKIELPNEKSAFSGNDFANFLFDISSVLPERLSAAAAKVGFNPQNKAKGFIFNADAATLIKLLNFGSLGALR